MRVVKHEQDPANAHQAEDQAQQPNHQEYQGNQSDMQNSTICGSMAAVLTGTFQVFTFDRHILMISTLYI